MPDNSTTNNRSPRSVVGTLIILLLCSCAGCNGSPASVSGTVSLDGKPLDRGMVSFQPRSGGQLATGTIQSNGRYSLSTNREQGLQAGEYIATVILRERGEESEIGGPPMPGKYIVPREYSSTETSGLNYQVTSGKNTIHIELNSNPQNSSR